MPTLGDLCTFATNLDDADFWLIAHGPEVGKPLESRASGAIGVKVTRTDVLLPRYLYYVLLHQYQQGAFRSAGKLTPDMLASIETS